jgi:hypothetical protein
MNDKVSRIALVLIGLAVSAFVVKALVNDDSSPPGDATEAGPTGSAQGSAGSGGTGSEGAGNPDTPGAFDPLQGGTRVDEGDGGRDPEATDGAGGSGDGQDGAAAGGSGLGATTAGFERRTVGEPLADDTPVEVAIRYVPGTVSRYRVTNAIMQRNRDNGQAVGQRWDFEVTTKVAAAQDDGSARVQMTVDAIRIQALFPDGLQIDFDSKAPDDAALADRDRAVTIKPMLAVIGIPVEFRLAANGGCTDIEGVDAWHDAWADVVEALTPGSSRKTVSPYTPETVLLEWSEYLFPPILGGTLKAGEERTVQILRDTLQSAYVEAFGPLKVTHDDGDVFRLKLITTPTAKKRQAPPRSAQEGAVAGVRVLADADAYYAAWRFAREPGRLVDAEIDTKYQLHVSWERGQDPSGNKSYERVFLDVERLTRVDLLTDE